MADRIWAFLLTGSGIDRDDPETWSLPRPSGFQPVTRAGDLDGIWSPIVRSALDDLLGSAELRRERPRVLMTFPQPELTWTVPSAGWHFDYVPPQTEPGLRALQVFVVLNEVRSGGGGTAVLAGSHRLVDAHARETGADPRPRAVRSALSAKSPWLADLWGSRSTDGLPPAERTDRLATGATVNGVTVRVVEVDGRSGRRLRDAFRLLSRRHAEHPIGSPHHGDERRHTWASSLRPTGKTIGRAQRESRHAHRGCAAFARTSGESTGRRSERSGKGAETLVLDSVERPLASLFASDEAGLDQDFHVVGNGALAESDGRGEVADAGLAARSGRDHGDQSHSGRVPESLEPGGELLGRLRVEDAPRHRGAARVEIVGEYGERSRHGRILPDVLTSVDALRQAHTREAPRWPRFWRGPVRRRTVPEDDEHVRDAPHALTRPILIDR